MGKNTELFKDFEKEYDKAMKKTMALIDPDDMFGLDEGTYSTLKSIMDLSKTALKMAEQQAITLDAIDEKLNKLIAK